MRLCTRTFSRSLLQVYRTRMRISPSLVYSNVHILIVACALISGTWVLLGIRFSWAFLVASCTSAFLIYLVDRIWLFQDEDLINQPERVAWYERHRAVVWFATGIGCLLIGASLPALGMRTVLVGAALGLAALFYLGLESRRAKRLKANWVLKPLIIALGWVLGGVVLPVYVQQGALGLSVAGLAGYRFPLLLANVIVVDWPDRIGDAAAGIHSLSVKLDAVRISVIVVLFATLSLFICLCFGFWQSWPGIYYLECIAPILMIVIAFRLNKMTHHALVLYADLIIAWPLVTVAFIQLG